MDTSWKVVFYQNPGGRCPVQEFIQDQPAKARVFIDNKIAMLRTNGPSLMPPHAKKVDDGIWELRCRTLTGNFRLLYFFCEPEQEYVLLHAVLKKRGKLERQDIQTAKKRMWGFLASKS